MLFCCALFYYSLFIFCCSLFCYILFYFIALYSVPLCCVDILVQAFYSVLFNWIAHCSVVFVAMHLISPNFVLLYFCIVLCFVYSIIFYSMCCHCILVYSIPFYSVCTILVFVVRCSICFSSLFSVCCILLHTHTHFISLHFVLFYFSIVFCSVSSIPFCSILFYSILFYSILFCSSLF